MDDHTVTVTPEDGGYLVSCSEGCNLGTSAHQPDKQSAEKRAGIHRIATTKNYL